MILANVSFLFKALLYKLERNGWEKALSDHLVSINTTLSVGLQKIVW